MQNLKGVRDPAELFSVTDEPRATRPTGTEATTRVDRIVLRTARRAPGLLRQANRLLERAAFRG